MIKKISIDTNQINDWDGFHKTFAAAFGFPDFYGNNMNAWIDCMTYINDPDSGMTNFFIAVNDVLVIELKNSTEFKNKCPDIYLAVLECTAFVNYRKMETNDESLITISAN